MTYLRAIIVVAILCSSLGLVLVSSTAHCQTQAAAVKTESPPLLTFCDLMKNPGQFYGQKVRVAATWCWGFEWSYLYSRECMDSKNQAWVEIPYNAGLPPKTEKILKRLKDTGINSKADVIMIGELQGGRTYGHLNGWRYQFVVSSIEEAKQIPGDVP
jgi:hypothetical protein